MKISNRENSRTIRRIGFAIMILALAGALFISPLQAPVVLFKLSLVTLAAVAAYWIDKILNPHMDNGTLAAIISKPKPNQRVEKRGDDLYYDQEDADKIYEWDNDRKMAVELYKVAMIRRAVITFAIVVGVCLGL